MIFGGALTGWWESELNGRDTWEWDGDRWELRSLGGPVARVGCEMVYDEARGSTLLVGGTSDYQNSWGFWETWTWDGTTWALRSTSGPRGRAWHAMAYDSARERVVLFGGLSVSLQQDTWEWDGWAWTRVATSGPSARRDHAMAYDPVRKVTVMFGGMGVQELADTWEWDGVRWSERHISGPGARRDHAMAFSGDSRAVMLVGGRAAESLLGDAWVLDAEGWTQLPAGGPEARERSTLVAVPRRGDVLMHGGGRPAVQGSIWSCSDQQWEEVWEQPATRSFNAGTLDAGRGKIVMEGNAYPSSGRPETWEWDGRRWTHVYVPSPPNRAYHVMAYDSAREVVRLFGGAAGTYFSDNWEWNGERWTSINVAGPAGRSSPGFSYDIARDRLVVTGGIGHPSVYQDTWEFDGVSWRRFDAPAQLARWQVAQAYDPVRQRTVLVGGFNGTNRFADTWEWDGQSWSWVASDEDPAHPSARSYARLTFDPHSQKMMLLGGHLGLTSYLNDTWLWDGTSWERLETDGPPRWRIEFLQPDPISGHVLAYIDNNLWEFKPREEASVVVEEAEITMVAGRNGSFGVHASGSQPIAFRWTRNGDQLADGPRVRGTTTSSIYFEPVRPEDAGVYLATATNSCGDAHASPIVLRVVCAGDFNQDGSLDAADLFEFLEAFMSQDPASDFDHSGALDSRDFFAFLTEWFAGCA